MAGPATPGGPHERVCPALISLFCPSRPLTHGLTCGESSALQRGDLSGNPVASNGEYQVKLWFRLRKGCSLKINLNRSISKVTSTALKCYSSAVVFLSFSEALSVASTFAGATWSSACSSPCSVSVPSFMVLAKRSPSNER